VYEKELLAICFANAPLLKVIPKRECALFARLWTGLLHNAMQNKDASSWADFSGFPSVFCWRLFVVVGGSLAHARRLIWSTRGSPAGPIRRWLFGRQFWLVLRNV
jgi:hypothetical protein